ncbi:MAG: hypothetical protein KC621_09900 [Myxococcales bacterium]|nr:hypothetical protein [Myxococcales bacterium]
MNASSRWIGLLALLPPLLALGGTYAALASYEEGPASMRELRETVNAGTVVNGKKHAHGAVAEMEIQMARHDPKVLILGNSFANTNVNNNQIAWALGVGPEKVLTLSVPNSISSHWYAILKHRVYDDAYEVPMVVIVAGLQSLMMVEPYSEASYEDLMIQLEPREPVLGRYIDLSHPELRKLVRNRVLFRDIALNGLRDSALDLFFPGGGEAHAAALEDLFSDENIDMSRHTATVRAGHDGGDWMEGLPEPKDSLIEELCRMLQANGTTLVYIRTPMLDRTGEGIVDPAPPEVLREVESIFARYGHRFVDMYTLELPRAAYKNATHLSPEGARLFTMKVNETLVDVWGEDHRTQRIKAGGTPTRIRGRGKH